MHTHGKGRQSFLAAGALLGWIAVILQFYLILRNREASVPETIIRYFSFFTVLTNILAALCFSFLLSGPRSAFGIFFSRSATLTAITVYMCIVGIIYNVILRFLWNPQGLQRVADELLHVVNPLWFLLFWILYVSKSGMQWKHAFIWMVYPVLYVAFILFRGSFSGFYPYPFSDVSRLGYPHVLLNCTKTILAFFLVSLLFVGIGKRMRRRRTRRLLLLIPFFLQFNIGLGQVSRNRHRENLDVHRFFKKEISIAPAGHRISLRNTGGITVIDARPDSLSLGLIQYAENAPVFLQAPHGVKQEVERFLNECLQFNSAGGTDRIILVLNKLWLSDELNQQKDSYSAGRIKNLDEGKVYAERTSGVVIRAELYFNEQSDYYPLYRYDTVIAGALTIKEYAAGYLQEALISCLGTLKKWDSAGVNMRKGRKLNRDEIDRFNRRKYELPVLKDTPLRKGIYRSFDEFRNNKPSYPHYVVRKNKLTDEIYIPDSSGGETILTSLWGYCDGQNAFIRSVNNFFLLQRVNHSFYFYGAGTMVRDNRTYNIPFIPPGYPGAVVENAVAAGALIGSSGKKVKLEKRGYYLDWDSGSLY